MVISSKPALLSIAIGAAGMLSACETAMSPMATLETIAVFNDTRPGNITVTPQGRVIVTQQPLDQPKLRVVEILPDGSTQPFPNLDWSDGPGTGEVGIAATIGIASDSNGIVWILDLGSATSAPKLVAWDSVNDQLHRLIDIPSEATRSTSFLQDFALDEKREKIYIADMTSPPLGTAPQPAFVVVDIKSGTSRRVLEGAKALMPVATDIVINGSLVGSRSNEGSAIPARMGLNPITIDPAFEYVYFGTVNGNEIFRLPAAALADSGHGRTDLMGMITHYADKVPSDGIAVDRSGRVFVTDLESSGIGLATPSGYQLIAQDDVRLLWPDGLALGPGDWVYVTQDHLHGHPALNEGIDGSVKPYHVVRFKLPPQDAPDSDN